MGAYESGYGTLVYKILSLTNQVDEGEGSCMSIRGSLGSVRRNSELIHDSYLFYYGVGLEEAYTCDDITGQNFATENKRHGYPLPL